MLSELLIRVFIKEPQDTEDCKIRNLYGYLAGGVGIVANLILFAFKLTIGILTSSISIMADAFNNFSDMASSAVTIVGLKMSSAPPDKEHPFGHGRIEYISALIVAFMVMLVGIEFLKSSVERLLNPVDVKFDLISFSILLVSILVKVWLSKFNKLIGNRIDSNALKAAALDAMGDVLTSSTVVLSFLLSRFTNIPIDGIVGVIVSILILYAGFSLVRDTISPLLGEAPDEDLVNGIISGLLSYNIIIGVHDLIIHNYGVGKIIASIHVEIPSNIDVMDMHEVVDEAERRISEKFKIHLVIHMDPINIDDKEGMETKEEVQKILIEKCYIHSIHDFRIVGKGDKKNLIFDVVVHSDEIADLGLTEDAIAEDVTSVIKNSHPDYGCVIHVDRDFTI
ncbi:MAG: cation diffusion facilitator family transporter [Clostridioides sp.]|jgi:cation diffusion facilitator family transporter|nr:cation diffusion facilitator family transporter [Clostridioides sp.]